MTKTVFVGTKSNIYSNKNQLILDIKNKDYSVYYSVSDKSLLFNKIDKQPIFIKKSLQLFNRTYLRNKSDSCFDKDNEIDIFYEDQWYI